MQILLDTHILLWWLNDDPKLSARARQLISDRKNGIYVSHISLWEIQIKIMAGKLQANFQKILDALPDNEFQGLATREEHVVALAKLASHHQDPFDRMLVAQALSESFYLVTHDQNVALYSPNILLV